MSNADTTRLLVLGVTTIFAPANGYQLRRELLSWDVEHWANVQPGSIYSMLNTLTKQGFVERFDLTLEDARPVAVYRPTDAGLAELRTLVSEGIVAADPYDRSLSYAAFSLMVMVFARDEAVPLLERRQLAIADALAQHRERRDAVLNDRGTPLHVARLMESTIQLLEAELGWLEGFTENVRKGDLVFLGEEPSEDWKPAPDDPAWRMVDEREVYLKAIADLQR